MVWLCGRNDIPFLAWGSRADPPAEPQSKKDHTSGLDCRIALTLMPSLKMTLTVKDSASILLRLRCNQSRGAPCIGQDT